MVELKTPTLRLLNSKNLGFWTFYYFDKASSNDSKTPAGSRRHAVKLHLDIDEKDYTDANINKILQVMIVLRQLYGANFPVIDFKRCQINQREYEFDYLGHAQFTIYLAQNKPDDIIAQFIFELNEQLQQLNKIAYSSARGDCVSVGIGISLRYDTSSSAKPNEDEEDEKDKQDKYNKEELDEIQWSIAYKFFETLYANIQELSSYQVAIATYSDKSLVGGFIKKFLSHARKIHLLSNKIFIDLEAHLISIQANIKKDIMQIENHNQIEHIGEIIKKNLWPLLEDARERRNTIRKKIFQQNESSLLALINEYAKQDAQPIKSSPKQ